METVLGAAGLLVAIKLYSYLSSKLTIKSTAATVADAKFERYMIEKEIMLLETFILERELEIGVIDDDKKEEVARKIEAAEMEIRNKKRELRRAEDKVFREEMLETL